jgi:DNA-binding LytR/AlgR family response regulator
MSAKSLPTLRCLIIDDETHAHSLLQDNISQVSWLELAGNAYNGIDALAMIAEIQPDLIFLDVNMPSISGLQMLEMLPDSKIQVILTTAYHHYAVDGFDYNVTDFLLKPAFLDRFLKAITKAMEIYLRRTGMDVALNPADTVSLQPQSGLDSSAWKDPKSTQFGESHVTLKVEKKLHRIPYSNIIFLEGSNNYVNVYTHTGTLNTRGSLTDFDLRLPRKQFLRVQKSYIINREYAHEIDGGEIIMERGFKITIPKTERSHILQSLAK